MDAKRFDPLTRSMTTAASRRSVLRSMFGGALAAAGFVGAARGGVAKGSEVDICHYDKDSGIYHRINVSTNAYDAHIAHGDNSDIGCAEGYALNIETCACEPTVVDECSGIGSACANGGTCAENQDNGLLICVNIGSGDSLDSDCTSSGDCNAAGEICVFDGQDGVRTHCHPHYQAS